MDSKQNNVVSKEEHDSDEALEGLSNMFVEREMTREEIADYRKQIRQSGGFDVKSYPKYARLCGGVRPITRMNEERRKLLSNYSKAALQEYNANKNSNYEFVGVVKANHQSVSGRMYYITFEAKHTNAAAANQISVIFQARVWEKLFQEGIQVKECTIKPTQ